MRDFSLSRKYIELRRRNVKSSARKRNITFSLSHEQIRKLHMEFPGCPRCGLSFVTKRTMGTYPTFDRIDPSYGYIGGNVQLLCKVCNDAKKLDIVEYIPRSMWHPAARELWMPELSLDLLDMQNRRNIRR